MSDLTVNVKELFSDRIRLPRPIGILRSDFKNAVPFPHVVMDGLFSSELLDPLLAEMNAMRPEQWMVVEKESAERFLRMRSVAELGENGIKVLALAHSPAFLYLLSEITGVWQLLPDPYLQGAGYASMRHGDFFNLHSDRSVAYETGLTRRLAMIVFLNKSWKREYNGQLELWNAEATKCEVTIEPVFNRTIVFEVANPNFHGVPSPIACPLDQSRQSFMIYYHTVGIDQQFNVRPHSSIFAPQIHRTNRILMRNIAREVTPPVLRKAVGKLLRLGKSAFTRT
jgi:hypothetical protein